MEDKIDELKTKVNKSLGELVRIVLQQKKRIDALEERLEHFNKRSGQKI